MRIGSEKKRASILIIGLVGYNMGDEAIAYVSANVLSQKYAVKVVSLRKGVLAKYGINEVYFVPRSIASWFNLVRQMLGAKYILIGGGSLVQDKLGGGFLSGVIGYLNLITCVASSLGKPIISLPIGVDDINAKNFSLASSILKRFKKITVRDCRSKVNVMSYSKDCLVPSIVPDPAFLIESSINQVSGSSFGNAYVCVSLAKENSLDLNSPIVLQLIEAICCWVEDGYSVVLLCMDPRADDEISVYNAILRVIAAKNDASRYLLKIQIITPTCVQEAVSLLRGAEALLAMRLHAVIIAYSYTKIFCISRTTKTKAICEELEIDNVDIETNSVLDDPSIKRICALNFSFSSSSQKINLLARKETISKYFDELFL